MANIPQSKEAFLKLCAESGTSFPYSEDISCLAKDITIAGKKINNRIVYQAMEGCDGTFDGAPDELTYRRYLRFARGGAGIIWFEATAVLNEGRANPRQMYLTEKTEDEFKKIVNDIKEECLKENGFEPIVIVQLTHSGRYSKPEGTPAPLIAYNNPIFEGNSPIDKSRIVTDEYLGEPIFAIDLCEHAYMLDYGFSRDEYLRRALGYLDLRKLSLDT